MDLQSEAVNNGVVGCNAILILPGLEGGNKNCVGVTIVGGQDELITAVSSDGESPSVVCLYLGDRFGPNVHLV